MEENKPFYTFRDSRGIGVFLDGGCGFQLGDFREEDKVHPALRIVPLKYKQEPGELNDDNEMILDAGFLEFAFGSVKSIDILIEVLNLMKEETLKHTDGKTTT